MIRIVAKLFAVVVALTTFLPVAASATPPPLLTFVASNGSDSNPCTAALPCATFNQAFSVGSGGQIICLDPTGFAVGETAFLLASFSLTIDRPGTIVPLAGSFGITFPAANQVFKIRNLTFDGTIASAGPGIRVTGSGTLILENCVFENLTGTALDIEPTGSLTLVVTNSRISNNSGGVLIKPAAGGSVTATFDGDTIVNNTGGLKTDTTNGTVTVDVSNSTISKNTANGMNIIGGAGGPNVVNLSHDVIASNGQVGIEASGVSAAVFVDTTLFDTNTLGATSAVAGGRLLTYSNNRIVGPAGSGFTSTLPLN